MMPHLMVMPAADVQLQADRVSFSFGRDPLGFDPPSGRPCARHKRRLVYSQCTPDFTSHPLMFSQLRHLASRPLLQAAAPARAGLFYLYHESFIYIVQYKTRPLHCQSRLVRIIAAAAIYDTKCELSTSVGQ